MRRFALLVATPVLLTFLGVTAIAVIAALNANACRTPAGGVADQSSAAGIREIPAQLLPIYEQVGARYQIPWEVLAGIGPRSARRDDLPTLRAPYSRERRAPEWRTPPAPPV